MDTVPPPPPPAYTPASAAPSDEKTIAIICYITIVGFVVALVMNNKTKSAFAAYHLRQMLGLSIVGFAISLLLVIPILGWIAWFLLFIGLAVLWLISLLGAASHKCKPTPLLGEHFQKWFAGAFT